MRLHLRFNIFAECPSDAILTEGKGSETDALRPMLLPGQPTWGIDSTVKAINSFQTDRSGKAFSFFVSTNAPVIHVEEPLPLTAAEIQSRSHSTAWVHLGRRAAALDAPAIGRSPAGWTASAAGD